MSAEFLVEGSAIKEFLLQARELSPEGASQLFEKSFPPGDATRDEAMRFWQRAESRRAAALQPEPARSEREELKAAGYELQPSLGSGGGGIVYLAIQQNPRRTVAVKFLATKLGREGAIRMEREIEQTCKIQHPDLVQVYKAGGTSRGRPYFVMEHVDGADIFTQCQQKGWNLDRRARLMARVCEAVAALHRRGVIHQDLKPGNILVSADGHPKIIDFGIARSAYADWRDEKVARLYSEPPRTEDYAPPEQREIRPVDMSADCFALGRVLLKLLTGELCDSSRPVAPGESEIPLDSRTLGFASEAALRKRYRSGLDAIVLKATAVDPGRRYREAGAMAEDLHRFLNDLPLSAVPRTTAYEVGLFVRRNPWWVAASALLVLLLVLATGNAWREKVNADGARGAAETALREERAAKESAKTSQQEAERSSRSFGSTVALLEETVKSRVRLMANHQKEYKLVEIEQWVSLWEQAKERLAPEEVEMSMLKRALQRIEDAGIEHPRTPALSARANFLAPRVGNRWRSSQGLMNTAAWNLNQSLQMALLELAANGRISHGKSLEAEVGLALPGRRDDLAAWRALRETACGGTREQGLLRDQIKRLKEICQ